MLVETAVGAGERQQLADQPIEVAGLALDAVQFRDVAPRIAAGGRDRARRSAARAAIAIHANIRQEPALGDVQVAEVFGHAIEITAERTDLVAPGRK